MAKKDYSELSAQIISLIGGKENISYATHCITRLRLNLKDKSLVQEDEIKKIPSLLGAQWSGEQFQIICGNTVDQIYEAFITEAGIESNSKINENIDNKSEKKPITLKSIGGAIMDGLAGSLTPIIPALLAASMFKMLVAVLGPSMLNIMSETSDLYTLFTFVGDSVFYFFPVFVGYTSAKKFGVTPVLGIMIGAILLHPTWVTLVESGTAFHVYGIPASLQSYSSTLLPVILSVWVMSYIEKFFKKIIPDAIKVMAVPTFTIAVMLPLALCILGPLGGFLGKYICAAIIWFGNTFGFLGAAIIGALWEFLVMTGMHQVMITQMILLFTENGYDPVVSLGAVSASLAVTGMCLGSFLALKSKEGKETSFTTTIAAFIGGVTEPGLYGVGIRYRSPLIGMAIGGFAGGLYAGLLGIKAYNMVPVANFIALTAYVGGDTSANIIHGTISGIIAIVVATIATYILVKKDLSNGKIIEE